MEPAALEAWIVTLPAELALVVMEATGGLEVPVAGLLAHRGLPVAVVNPRQVRHFAKALGELAKTDRLDAQVLALFAQRVRPEPRPLKDAQAQELSELMSRRQQLTDMVAAEKTRLHQARSPRVRTSIEQTIAWLQRQLKEHDTQLDRLIKASPVWRAREELLTSVPGVGVGTSRVFAAGLPEIGHLGRRKIGKLVGVAPFAQDSGPWKGQRKCAGGRAAVRTALYMATFNATQHNPVIRRFFQHLQNQGKSYKVAMVACMHKLLTILNTMVRNNTKWNEQLYKIT